jgi:Flp pilus assembly protein TadD
MSGEPGAKGAPRPSTDERAQGPDVPGLGERERDVLLAWVGENLPLVRRLAFGQRTLYWSLGIGFVVGLAAYVGGFLIKFSATTEPLLLVADLLYALGWSLWTGVVVVVFVQIYPETKKRQYKQALDAYEAAVRDGWAPDPAGTGDPAEQWYRKAADADAGDVDAMVDLVAALWKQGKDDQAVQWYRKAADAGSTDAMFTLGALLRKQGKEDQAEQWYRKAADAGRRDG